MPNRAAVSVGIILGILFVIIGFVYATHTADKLPSYFPGHDVTLTTVHVKHSIAAFVLAVLSFVYAWFQSGKKQQDLPS